MEFVDQHGDEVSGRAGSSFDLTVGSHSGYATKVADELFGEFAEMGWSRFSHGRRTSVSPNPRWGLAFCGRSG